MRATKPARLLVWTVGALDRFWGLLGFAVAVALETLVFAPRQQTAAMVWGGIVGAAFLLGWLVSRQP
jgi:hypothetical protein